MLGEIWTCKLMKLTPLFKSKSIFSKAHYSKTQKSKTDNPKNSNRKEYCKLQSFISGFFNRKPYKPGESEMIYSKC